MRNLLLGSIIFIIFQSCVSFESTFNPYKLDKHNLNQLDGIYEINHAGYNSKYVKANNSYTSYSENFFKEIDRHLLRDTLKIDSSKNYKLGLKVLSDKLIKIDYIQDDSVFRSRTLKTKLKKDGYLYLKNKNIGIRLIPYLLGGIDIKKSRITLSKEKNLVFDYSQHVSGAFLFLIFLDGETSKRRLEYGRIE
ncbi:hypothetical protein [Sphingobacterium sp.]|uniref:hypothetical protein n=1 Tax=Sphingobacterium sp. TaxID=341027 RepID=UPI00289F68A0|nr:hypothetical protein [Sphingobacterium sp.]